MGKLAQVPGSSERANDPVRGLYGTLVGFPRRSSLRQHTHWGRLCSSARAGMLRGEETSDCRLIAACAFSSGGSALGTVKHCARSADHARCRLLMVVGLSVEVGLVE